MLMLWYPQSQADRISSWLVIGVSAIAAALEMDKYGNCEPRYAKILKPKFYQQNGNYFSYGVKLLPGLNKFPLNKEQSKFIQIYR